MVRLFHRLYYGVEIQRSQWSKIYNLEKNKCVSEIFFWENFFGSFFWKFKNKIWNFFPKFLFGKVGNQPPRRLRVFPVLWLRRDRSERRGRRTPALCFCLKKIQPWSCQWSIDWLIDSIAKCGSDGCDTFWLNFENFFFIKIVDPRWTPKKDSHIRVIMRFHPHTWSFDFCLSDGNQKIFI